MRMAALTLFLLTAPAAAFEHPGGLHTKTQIEFVRAQVSAGTQPFKFGYDQLLAKAKERLDKQPRAMEDFHVEPYYSSGKEQHIQMKTLLSEDATVAYCCALVYQLNIGLSPVDRKGYAEKAKVFLNDWASVNERVSGRDGKLVMCYNGVGLVFAAELLWDYEDWSEEERTQFESWAKNVLYASSDGRKGHSNRANWYLLAAMAVDHLTDNEKQMQADIALIKPTIDRQIKPDGGMPEELRRGSNSMWYTYFALAPLTACMEIARNSGGPDLFDYNPPSGGTVKDALDFLFRHGIEQPDSWPVKGARNMLQPDACGGNLFYATGLLYDDAKYRQWVKHPIWRDSTGLAWICPSLMAPLEGKKNATARAEEASWRFVSVPDFLNADRTYPVPNQQEGLDFVLSGIADEKPDFVVVPGDLVDGRWATGEDPAKSIREKADTHYGAWNKLVGAHGLKIYAGMGDHEYGDDPWPAGKDRFGQVNKPALLPVFREVFRKHMNPPDNGAEGLKGSTWFLRHKNLLIVSVDTFEVVDTPGKKGSLVRCQVTGKQLAWVRETLDTHADARWKIVMGHVPIMPNVRSYRSSNCKLVDGVKSPLWRLMAEKKVDAYLCGEVHTVTCSSDSGVEQIAHGDILHFSGTSNYLLAEGVDNRLCLTIKKAKLALGIGRDSADQPVSIEPPPEGKQGWHILGKMVLEDGPGGRQVVDRTGCFDHR